MKIMKNLCITLLFIVTFSQVLFGHPNIILFGLPGAGKGTLSQKLIEKYEYVHICPGNLLRAEVRYKTDFGNKIEQILEKGDYVAEQDLFAFLKSKIIEAQNANVPIIFDGYPRSVEALTLLDALLEELGIRENTIVLHLKIEKEKLLGRVLNRAVCNKCNKVYSQGQNNCDTCLIKLEKRPQDTAEILKKRIDHYEQIAKPLLQSFAAHGYQVVEVEIDVDSKEIFKRVCRLLESHFTGEHPKSGTLKKNSSMDSGREQLF